jgi:methionyl-tRNA formyltransferase
MKHDLRIVFMGTPDFAVASLKTLVDNNYTIVGVITAPDRPAGRGRKLHESAVKVYAKEQQLNILQPTNLKSESFLAELKALNANLQIVGAFRMLPILVWQMPALGTFNLHASLLPDYRGAAPINWAIINGETVTGVSTFFIDEKIDTGDMILQETVAIALKDTAGDLHDTLMGVGSRLVLKTVKQIESGTVQTTRQKELATIKEAPKLNRDNCKIDWTDSIDNIYNLIRGLSPYPAAWCQLINGEDNFEIKIYKASITKEAHNLDTGTVVSAKKSLHVAVKNGYIKIEVIKFPGKRKMDSQSLLNGYQFLPEAKVL